jgi:hypothetical protein
MGPVEKGKKKERKKERKKDRQEERTILDARCLRIGFSE